MARPKLYTKETLEKAIDKYFSDCKEDNNIFPDEAGMLLYLNISENTYRRYMEDIELGELIARARRRRESWLVRRMTSEPKLAQGCLNSLMQQKNGGYTNRPDNTQQSVEINVKIAGCEDFNPGA